MKVIEEKVFEHHFYSSISILENIFHKHEKIPDIDFRLMLQEHYRFHRPTKRFIVNICVIDERYLHIHEDMGEQVVRLVGESELPSCGKQLDGEFRYRVYRYHTPRNIGIILIEESFPIELWREFEIILK